MTIRTLCLVVAAGCSAVPAHAAITHRYTFNDDGQVLDSVGNVNGTLMNGATVSGGRLVFDPLVNTGTNTNAATGQYVTLPTNLLHTTSFSIEAWVKWDGGSAWQRVVDMGRPVLNQSPPPSGNIGMGFIILSLNGTLRPIGQISLNSWGGANDTNFVTGSSALSSGVEHMLTYTHNGQFGVDTMYVDGSMVGNSTGNVVVDAALANYTKFYFGRSQFDVDPFFHGSMNEIRTYDTAISNSSVFIDFRAGPTPVPEPAAGAFFTVGGACLLWRRGRRGAR